LEIAHAFMTSIVAARVGNLAAPITLHQIGTTGMASCAQIAACFAAL